MLLFDVISNIRIEVQDADAEVFTADDLTRAVEKSVALMGRAIPKKAIVETTLSRSITGETLTIALDTGTLLYKPIKQGSEAIVDGSSVTKTRDTDYTIDYLTGIVTEIGTNLPNAEYTVAYALDLQLLDISSILSDFIRIEKVEYPATEFPPFDLVTREFLSIKGDTTLTSKKQLRIIYLDAWTAPTASADGDYPEHLNDAVIIGSAGQALLFKAEKYLQQVITLYEEADTELDSVAAQVTAAIEAIVLAETAFSDAKTTLGGADTPIGDADSAADKVTTEVAAAKDFLTDGKPLINVATRGDTVGQTYGLYANSQTALANTYISEAVQRLAIAGEWLRKAGQEEGIGANYLNDATQRLNIAKTYFDKSARKEALATQYLSASGRYLASGQAKIDQFLAMLGTRVEFQPVSTMTAQPSY